MPSAVARPPDKLRVIMASHGAFITCDHLRVLFNQCRDDINKRILIIDVRNASEFDKCHLTLDSRNSVDAIRRKMRVININPDTLRVCTTKQIMASLNEADLNVFKMRKDATDVVIIDNDTPQLSSKAGLASRVTRLINGLTRYDNESGEQIQVPIKVLKGGFIEWLIKYPHFTTDPSYNPEEKPMFAGDGPVNISPTAALAPDRRTKPVIIKNAPGTAVPVTSFLALPRSQSSPNVAQAELDELDIESNKFTNLNISSSEKQNEVEDKNVVLISKPRFDRALKPAFNVESVNAIRAQLNFGRCPEASGRVITGLQNLGNTCFMNSVIQCLAYAPQIVTYFCSEIYYNHINFSSKYGTNGELAIEFGALVDKLNSHLNRYIEPKSFREAVVRHIGFAGCEQQDSHEFMMMLFDKLHHDLNLNLKERLKQKEDHFTNGTSLTDSNDNNMNVPRATLGYQFWKKHLEFNKSIISDAFEGIFMSTLICSFCDGQSNTFEVFNCLSLPIPSESRCHLRDCLSYFSRPEKIEAAWECPRCKQKREAVKKIVICKLPKILIIHLKRLVFTEDLSPSSQFIIV